MLEIILNVYIVGPESKFEMSPSLRIPIFLLFVVSVSASQRFTALEIDNHPCKPENLKVWTHPQTIGAVRRKRSV